VRGAGEVVDAECRAGRDDVGGAVAHREREHRLRLRRIVRGDADEPSPNVRKMESGTSAATSRTSAAIRAVASSNHVEVAVRGLPDSARLVAQSA
jgi:hypothetical protein